MIGNSHLGPSMRSKTKTQAVHENLKAQIVKGHLEPGTRLIISALARKLGVSEIPIREALKQLEAEGLVQSTPHVGFVVSKPDFQNHEQIFTVRQLLEGQAAYLAAKNATALQLKKAAKLIAKMKGTDPENTALQAELNIQFHDLIFAASGNPLLHKLIVQVWAMAPRSKAIFSLVKGRVLSSNQEHEQIYLCIKNGDAEGARRSFIEHKQRSYDLLLRLDQMNAETQTPPPSVKD